MLEVELTTGQRLFWPYAGIYVIETTTIGAASELRNHSPGGCIIDISLSDEPPSLWSYRSLHRSTVFHLYTVRMQLASFKLEFHDTDTDTDILADILARIFAGMSACRASRRGSSRGNSVCRA